MIFLRRITFSTTRQMSRSPQRLNAGVRWLAVAYHSLQFHLYFRVIPPFNACLHLAVAVVVHQTVLLTKILVAVRHPGSPLVGEWGTGNSEGDLLEEGTEDLRVEGRACRRGEGAGRLDLGRV